jgi:hypothetical protein
MKVVKSTEHPQTLKVIKCAVAARPPERLVRQAALQLATIVTLFVASSFCCCRLHQQTHLSVFSAVSE